MLWGDGPLGQSQSRGSDGEVHLSRMNAGKDGHREPPSVPPWFPGFPAQREPICWSLDRILSAKAALIKGSWLLLGLTQSNKQKPQKKYIL